MNLFRHFVIKCTCHLSPNGGSKGCSQSVYNSTQKSTRLLEWKTVEMNNSIFKTAHQMSWTAPHNQPLPLLVAENPPMVVVDIEDNCRLVSEYETERVPSLPEAAKGLDQSSHRWSVFP